MGADYDRLGAANPPQNGGIHPLTALDKSWLPSP